MPSWGRMRSCKAYELVSAKQMLRRCAVEPEGRDHARLEVLLKWIVRRNPWGKQRQKQRNAHDPHTGQREGLA